MVFALVKFDRSTSLERASARAHEHKHEYKHKPIKDKMVWASHLKMYRIKLLYVHYHEEEDEEEPLHHTNEYEQQKL